MLEYSCYGASPLLHSIVVSAETLLRNGMVFIDITLSYYERIGASSQHREPDRRGSPRSEDR